MYQSSTTRSIGILVQTEPVFSKKDLVVLSIVERKSYSRERVCREQSAVN